MKLRAAGSSEVVEAEPLPALPRGVRAARQGNVVWVFAHGETYRVEKVLKVKAAGEAEHDLRAPMPGKVTRVFVEPGAAVLKGAPLLVLEAMKMEHQIRAPHGGRVVSVKHAPGTMVALGDVLVEIE